MVLPVADESTLSELRRVFDLRRSNEPGLSVVVPWIHEAITADAFVVAVAGEYFLPILRGELTVEVDNNGAGDLIDAARLVAVADAIDPPLVRARVGLGLEAATWPDSELIRVSRDATLDFDWFAGRLSEEQRSLANQKLEAGAAIGFRVPTRVRPKERADIDTHFDVFLRQVPGLGRVRSLIVREGITIAEDRTSYLQDHVALVIIDHSALATFVGDSETPAHNELQYDLVKGKYTLAGKLIGFLRSAPAAIIRDLEAADRAADHSLLAEFFPRREPAPLPRKPKAKESSTGDEVEEIPDIPTRRPRFRIRKIDSGFTVAGTEAMKSGSRVTVECAYEIRRGNPLRKYRDLDFAIERDVSLRTQGVLVQSASGNRIVADVDDPKFAISADGFDRNRNLFVRVTIDELGAES